MRVILLADLHAHAWSEFATLVEYRGDVLNSRLVDALLVLDRVTEYAQQHGIEQVIIAGDLFHRRRLIDVPVYNGVSRALQRMARAAKVWLLVGNHDMVRRSWDGDHALTALGAIPGVRVVDRPRYVGRIGLIPYSDDRQELLRGLESVSRGPRLLIMHAGVRGAKTGPLEYQPPEPLELEDLPDVPIYSGHYHRPHWVTGPRRRHAYRYIGSPIEHVRGESLGTTRRGFLVVDTTSPDTAKRVRIQGPRFVTVSDMAAVRRVDVEGNFVDLVVRPDDAARVERWTRRLEKKGARGVMPQYQAAETTRRPTRIQVQGGGLPAPYELCQAYVDGRKGEEAKLDAERLMVLARMALAAVEESER